MSAFEWAMLAHLLLSIVLCVESVVAFRRRPGAPPNSSLIRWSVIGIIALGVAVFVILFLVATRNPHGAS